MIISRHDLKRNKNRDVFWWNKRFITTLQNIGVLTDMRFEIHFKLKNANNKITIHFFPRYLPPQPSAKPSLLKHLTNTHPLV